MTVGAPPCTVAQTELVVPRSMPMTSSPKLCLQRPEELLGLLVIGGDLQQRGQLGAGPRLPSSADEETCQHHARAGILRIQLHGPDGPGGGGARVRSVERAARGPHRGLEA